MKGVVFLGVIKLLSVDFDFFPDADNLKRSLYFPESGETLPEEIQRLIWLQKYSTSNEIQEVGIKQKEFDFMKRLLAENKDAELTVADSHLAIMTLVSDFMKQKKPLEIYNVDYHHDLYFNTDITCGNWLQKFFEMLDVKKCLWIKDPESIPLFMYDKKYDYIFKKVDITEDIQALKGIGFDYIFVCKSGMWTPPHLDRYFVEMLNAYYESKRYKLKQDNNELNRFNAKFIDEIKVHADAVKKILETSKFFDKNSPCKLEKTNTCESEFYLLKKDMFTIENGYITYKGVNLWRTETRTLSGYEFYLIDETMYPHGFLTLTCYDDNEDMFHYGKFGCLQHAINWLNMPTDLYI